MSLLGLKPPTMQELLKIRDFFLEGCDFYWRPDGSEKLPEMSLLLFRQYDRISKVCKECSRRDCPVRMAPYQE